MRTALVLCIALQAAASASLESFRVGGPAPHYQGQDLIDGSQQALTLPSEPVLDAKLDSAIEKILADFHSPAGVGIAIVRKDAGGEWAVQAKGYGNATLRGMQATGDTLWAIGSNSKLFDVLATGLLVANESLRTRITWETKLVDVVPEWGLMDPVADRESTIIDIMSHRTGLPPHDIIIPSDTVPDTIRRLRYLRPSTGFRNKWQYNNHMYTVLSYLPPLLTGIPFETYVEDNIFKPLGMSDTTYYSTVAEATGRLSQGIERDGANRTADVFAPGTPRALPFWMPNGAPGHVMSGAGAIISSARDIATWIQMLLNEGKHPYENTTVIPASAIRRVSGGIMVTDPVAAFPELSPKVYGGAQWRGTYRGFGQCLALGISYHADDTIEYIEHGGTTFGHHSQITRVPSQNFGVAVLTNDDSLGGYLVSAIRWRLLDELLGLEPINWTARFHAAMTKAFHSTPKAIPRSSNATLPTIPFPDLAGMYTDLGYGTMELCFSPESSTSCNELLQEWPTILPGTLNSSIPTLVARWPIVFGLSHIKLEHFSGNVFNLTILGSRKIDDPDKPFFPKVIADVSMQAEFALDGPKLGVGLCGVWGPGDDIEAPEGSSVKDKAEVWFEKL
ncbi:Beta-lactamase class penicillin binding protein [Mycena indigotica]|uniref:Beta-lactamase class penicillin binding protein n=1 Tax=Mycena indigotica TaxID=2126181 RepID=A0A8H6VZI3_9AGAR|nr:Beta-lactamase class penicillin binding protein [Mycena indigotica]KAF7297526.1 Beta-lactamase class penicillin binding protein [Mycena indigotica]